MNLEIGHYIKSNGSIPVKEFFERYSKPVQARFARTIELLRDGGLQIGMPYIKPLTGIKGGWELRVKADKHLLRCGFIVKDKTAILLHGFEKKTKKTEKKDIETIKDRIKEIS